MPELNVSVPIPSGKRALRAERGFLVTLISVIGSWIAVLQTGRTQFDASAPSRYAASSLGALSIAAVFCEKIQIFRRIDG
jgi:hypothetical protein